MAKNINYVSHKKSKVKVNGKPQLPSADSLVEGEIAINFAENVETLSIKNESGAVVTFSSDNYYSEQKLGSAFTGANSAVTVTDEFGLYVKKTDVDQVIDETTSASTSAVSTSAVYEFVTSHTPSITVDQVLDDTTSASTNPVATKAVYSVITDNELVWSMAFLAMSGNVSSHTVNTNIHMTPTEKTNIDALASNIGTLSAITATSTAINSLTGSVGTMAFQNTSSYSSATQVNTALSNKANTSDIANFFDDAKYENSGTTKVINFYHGNTIKATIDATDFIKDGMISGVTLESKSGTTYLVINWNTDAGIQTTELNIGDLFEADNYYNKTEIDDLVGSGFTSSSITDVIIENELIVSNALTDLDERKLDASAYTPTDLSNYYTKSETSGKTEIANALSGKVDATEYATFSASTNNSIDDLSGQSETIAAALVNLNTNKLDITAYTPTTLLEETTYSALKSKRDSGQLVQGQWYRITDYTCTTTQENTQSAGHQFDIIVRADDVNVLNENAYAAKHSGDTYFTNASAKLNAWELKYSLDNDTTKYYWADTTNGKGVIYYMKDEWNNECPYDFKNIQFKRYKITASTKCPDLVGLYAIDGATDVTVDTATTYWSYTFCMYDLNENAPCDVSTYQDKYYSDEGFCYKNYNNVFKSYLEPLYDEDGLVPMKLLNNVFITDTNICSIEGTYGEFYGFNSNTFGHDCTNNTFGHDCYYNTFGSYCRGNSFGNGCTNNTFGNGCYSNRFGNNCDENSFGDSCEGNSFENGCGGNTFGTYCRHQTFGDECGGNTFGDECHYNTFGHGCYNNTFGNICGGNTFGNGCNHITFSKNYCYYNIVENGNQYITLNSSATTSSSNVLRNITIAQGVNNTTTLKTISHNTVNDTFQTRYKPTNSVDVSI